MIIAACWALLLVLIVIHSAIAIHTIWKANVFGWGEVAAIVIFCGPLLIYIVLITEELS